MVAYGVACSDLWLPEQIKDRCFISYPTFFLQKAVKKTKSLGKNQLIPSGIR